MSVDARQLSVPFSAVTLNKNATISVNYSFGEHLEIFCFDSGLQTIGLIYWPYNGNTYSSSLPVLLKTSSDVTGNYADTSGVITIQNNTTQKLLINCLFGF
jgi:hypothetical protein